MSPQDCSEWDYEDVPGYQDLLLTRTASIVGNLRRGTIDTRATATDSRPIHQDLFQGLTPPTQDYFAGHYRGEQFKCLRHYRVRIESDDRVGYAPDTVPMVMTNMVGKAISDGIAALDQADALPEARLPKEQKVLYVVAFACHVFEFFLRVHPYANGNGHAARFIVWAILGRFGYWPHRWPIEPKPADPPYTQLLSRHRDGDKEPLESWLLSCLVP